MERRGLLPYARSPSPTHRVDRVVEVFPLLGKLAEPLLVGSTGHLHDEEADLRGAE
jgi:hypothetical protein